MIILFKWTIAYAFSILTIIFITGAIGGVDFTLRTIVLILTGIFEPDNIWQDVMLFFVVLFQLFPAFAFLEVRTIPEEEKLSIKISLMQNHVIIIGLNHISHRSSETLQQLNIPYVVVLPSKYEESSHTDLDAASHLEDLQEWKVPVVHGVPTSIKTLQIAGIKQARGIIITGETEDLNIVIAKKAKMLNPQIKTIVRVFREEAMNIYQQTGFVDEFISSSLMASLFYVMGCYLNIDTTYPPTIRIEVGKTSRMVNKKPSEVEKITSIAVLGIIRNESQLIRDDVKIQVNDRLIIYGRSKDFNKLINFNIKGK